MLQDKGFSRGDAERGLTAVLEAASAFQSHYQGKPQLYLRKQADAMLSDLLRLFQFSALSAEEARHAVIYWLQNAVNMPIPLATESLHKYCEAHGITADQLIEAADEVGLNVNIADDLADYWTTTRMKGSPDFKAKGGE